MFWNWLDFGGLVVNIASSASFLFLIMADRPIAAFILSYALSVPYNILVTAGVCRSAERYTGKRKWADLVRIVTIADMNFLSVT